MSDSLKQHRLRSADLSGGTSHAPIKNMIFHIIKKHHFGGDVLDYGAGKGELLEMLHQQGTFQHLSGADILPRPDSLTENILWYHQDLNETLELETSLPNLIICSEVIEHLENPRATFRELYRLLAPGGQLLLTMPNQECIRSLCGLVFGGHFAHFLGKSYPAHITALLRMDLQRICQETGFSPPTFYYSEKGSLPKINALTWQKISFGKLHGCLWSDNLAIVTTKE